MDEEWAAKKKEKSLKEIGQKYKIKDFANEHFERVIEINILNFYYCLKMMTMREKEMKWNDEERKGNHTQ